MSDDNTACCDAMRRELAEWVSPDHIGRNPIGAYVYSSPADSRIHCHLCGAEWGPVVLAQQRDAVLAEVERLRGVINAAMAALDSAEEINPANYDHDLVCELNRAHCEAWAILKPAATPTARESTPTDGDIGLTELEWNNL